MFARTQPTLAGPAASGALYDSPGAAAALQARLCEAAAFPVVALGAMHAMRHNLADALLALQRPVTDADAHVRCGGRGGGALAPSHTATPPPTLLRPT